MDNKEMLELFDRYEEKFGEAPPTYGYSYDNMRKELTEAIEANKPIKFAQDENIFY